MAGRVDSWVPFLGVQPASEHQSVTMGAGWTLPEGSACQWEKDRKQIHHPQGPAWRECGMAPGGMGLLSLVPSAEGGAPGDPKRGSRLGGQDIHGGRVGWSPCPALSSDVFPQRCVPTLSLSSAWPPCATCTVSGS